MSEQPKRIQRKRSKGWQMPDGAVYVGRPTKWGNQAQLEPWYLEAVEAGAMSDAGRRGLAAHDYREMLEADDEMRAEARRELRGKDLACWCPLDQPCHADVLLEIANAEPSP
jgi:hypothetical protein